MPPATSCIDEGEEKKEETNGIIMFMSIRRGEELSMRALVSTQLLPRQQTSDFSSPSLSLTYSPNQSILFDIVGNLSRRVIAFSNSI